MIRAIQLLTLWCLLTGCDGTGKVATDVPVDKGVGDLPHLRDKGRILPYLRYADKAPNSGNGRAFFLYPMMDERNELLALEYNPQLGSIEELFAEDMLGISGPVSNENGMIRIEFLPISLPIGVRGGQEWSLRYGKRDFLCRSKDVGPPQYKPGTLAVFCASTEYTLNYVFDKDRGIEEYQDFCGNLICTFKLLDEEGLLSKEVLDYMRLPNI
jgi:hypothetical protein